MGRGRGKGKKASASNDDAFEEEEKIPVQKRGGRPQKPLKEAFGEEEAEKVEEEEDGEDAKSAIKTKEPKSPNETENGNKRKRNTQVRHKPSSVKQETGAETCLISEEPSKPNGFRHDGSRRKSKPRRAAEAGV